MKEKEIWKYIKGYEMKYQISNLGQVKSLTGGSKRRKEKILKPGKTQDGYLFVGLYKDGKKKTFRISRLVATEFISNDDVENKTQVNHINENEKENNKYTNLEWVTPKENINYGTHNERQALARSKTVYQYSLEKVLIRKWNSMAECKKEKFEHSAICLCCQNRYLKNKNIYKGYIWSYTEL